MSIDRLDAAPASRVPTDASPSYPDDDRGAVTVGIPTITGSTPQRVARLAWVAIVVVGTDWTTKALAWRFLPGRAVINADTSGAVPILPGVLSQPVLGAVIDATVMVLLAVTAVWLARPTSLGRVAWAGCALVWSGIAANASDRWIGHLWLAPGSERGVVDWIGLGGAGSLNLADLTIGAGLLIAIAGLAGSRLSRQGLAGVVMGALLLMPVSMLTVSGTSSNAAPATPAPTFADGVRASFLVGPKQKGGRVLWRDWRQTGGWNLTVDAVDNQGLVLAEWYLPWDNSLSMLRLPEKTDAVYVRQAGNGWSITLADNLS